MRLVSISRNLEPFGELGWISRNLEPFGEVGWKEITLKDLFHLWATKRLRIVDPASQDFDRRYGMQLEIKNREISCSSVV
jgi:hypothetical protein